MAKKKASRKINVQRRKRKKGRAKYKTASFKKSVNKRNYDRKYMKTRAFVIARGRWKCGICDNFSSKLQVHHIRKWSSHPLLRTKSNNLIAVCRKCHDGVLKNREDQFRGMLMRRVRYQEKLYKKEPLTLDQVRELDTKNQLLPEGFKPFKYRTKEEVKIQKAKEFYLRKFWRLCKARCYNKNSKSYKDYGGRGIVMFEEWHQSYDKFLTWISENLGPRPSERYSLDRIDNDKGYFPDNLRWATPEQQGQNRRTTVLETYVAEAIFILHHKYGLKQSKLMYLMDLNSHTVVRGVTTFVTFKNVTVKYKSLVKDTPKNKAILDRIKEYEESMAIEQQNIETAKTQMDPIKQKIEELAKE
jgi:5-methylcytosine-specific restriction endonuclease McrA